MRRLAVAAAIGLAVIVSSACDPDKGVRKIFESQHLHVLIPLRSYIEVGGLVVVPKGGDPYYYDRLDTIPNTASDMVVDFNGVIGSQSRRQTAGFGAVLRELQKLVNAPVSFRFEAKQDVEMGQIDSSGTRLKIPAAQSLVQTGETKKWITQELARKSSKVYVVLEVWKARTLSVRASRGFELKVELPVGGESGRGTASPAPTSAQPGSTASAAAVPGASASTQQSPTATTTKSGAAVCGPTATPTPASAGSDDKPLPAFWKRSSTTEIVLCGGNEYPFAVRVAEVIADQNGLLLQPGNWRFPGALGAGDDVERYTAYINNQPALTLKRPVATGR